MFCPNCGSKLPDDARFCGSCGTPLQKSQSAPKATPASVPSKPKKEKKDGKKVLIVTVSILLVLAIAAGAIAAWQLFFAKDTVYLLVESSSYSANSPSKTSLFLEYSVDGSLLRQEYTIDYTDSYEDSGYEDETHTFSYQYENALMVGAEIDLGSREFELEYIYEEGILDHINVIDASEDFNLKFLIDESKIFSLKYLDNNGYPNSCLYEYHENGMVKEKRLQMPYGSSITTIYDEQGNTIEQYTYIENKIWSRTKQIFSEKGRLLRQSTYDENNELKSNLQFVPEYDKKGNLTSMEMIYEDRNNVGSIIFEAEYDGLKMTMIPVRILGTIDGIDEISEDTYIQVTYDEAGNIIETVICIDGEIYLKNTAEYKKFRVPKGYQKISTNDPFWFPLGS